MKELEEISKHDAFASLVSAIESNTDEWQAFYEADSAEDTIPKFEERKTELESLLKEMIILKVVRPDRFWAKTQ